MTFETISANKIDEYIGNKDFVIIDIRNPSEYAKGHIKTAINIPYNDIWVEQSSLPREKTLIFYCERGGASIVLSRDLSKEGYKVKNIYGGINAYRGPLET